MRKSTMDCQPSEPLSQYEIWLREALPLHYSHWFDNMTITYNSEGNTLLIGPIVDQAALHGLLDKVRDLGLELLEVRKVPRAGKG